MTGILRIWIKSHIGRLVYCPLFVTIVSTNLGLLVLWEDSFLQILDSQIREESMLNIRRFYLIILAAIVGSSIMVKPVNGFELFAVHFDSGDLYKVSTVDASVTLVSQLGANGFGGLEMGPDGFLYGFSTGEAPNPTLFKINATSYEKTAIGPIGLDFIYEGSLAFSSDGTAYAVNNDGLSDNQPQLFTIDINTGQGTSVGIISGGSHDINGMVWRSDGMLVGIDRVTNSLLAIDPVDATSTLIAELDPVLGIVGGMAALGDTAYFSTAGPDAGAFSGTNSLYTIDLFSGESSLVGSFEGTIEGTGFSGLAIPEPATFLFLLIGAGAVVHRRA